MLTIRQACPEDAPQLSAMGYASYHHHFAHGKIGTLLHKLYLMPGKTGHRYGEHFSRRRDASKTAGESWLWLEVLAANPAARRFTNADAAHQRHDFPLRQPAKHLTYSGQTDLRGTMPELRDTGVRNVVCGENVVIYQPANLYDCQLGDNVFVGPFVEIRGIPASARTVKFNPIPLSASTSPSASAALSVTA